MNRRRLADLFTVAGLVLAVTGVAAIYWPAALIVAGVGLAAIGLLVIEVKP